MPSLPYLAPPLAEGRVRLRDAAERDIPEILIAHEDDPTLYRRLGMERQPSGAELGREAENEKSRRAAGTGAGLTILEDNSDEFRGRMLVQAIEWESSRAELGVWVIPQARGRGLARVALRLAARWLFETCGLQRLQLLTEPANESMLRAAAAAGFVPEGVLRGYTRERDGRRDMAMLSMLPADLDDLPADLDDLPADLDDRPADLDDRQTDLRQRQ